MWNKTDMEEDRHRTRNSKTQIDMKKDKKTDRREVRETTERKKEAIRVDTQTVRYTD